MTWNYYDVEKEVIRRETGGSEVDYKTYVNKLNSVIDEIKMLPVPKTNIQLQKRMRLLAKFVEEAKRDE